MNSILNYIFYTNKLLSYLPKPNDFYSIFKYDCLGFTPPKEYALCLKSYFYCIKAVQGKH